MHYKHNTNWHYTVLKCRLTASGRSFVVIHLFTPDNTPTIIIIVIIVKCNNNNYWPTIIPVVYFQGLVVVCRPVLPFAYEMNVLRLLHAIGLRSQTDEYLQNLGMVSRSLTHVSFVFSWSSPVRHSFNLDCPLITTFRKAFLATPANPLQNMIIIATTRLLWVLVQIYRDGTCNSTDLIATKFSFS